MIDYKVMKAKDAAKLPDIVGKYIALKVWQSGDDSIRIFGGITLPHNNYWLQPDQEIIVLQDEIDDEHE